MAKKDYSTEKLKPKKERSIEEGFLMNQEIWKGKPLIGKVIDIKKAPLNYDCLSGLIKYFPGVMLKVQDKEGIKEAGIVGFVEDYIEILGGEISYLYEKIRLTPKKEIGYPLHMWGYSIELINNPEKEFKKDFRISL
jgi:hypothetical protein